MEDRLTLRLETRIPASEIRKTIHDHLEGLRHEGTGRWRAKERNLPVAALDRLGAADSVKVEQASSELDPALAQVIVVFAGVAARILYDVWREMILPDILEKRGPDSIKSVDK